MKTKFVHSDCVQILFSQKFIISISHEKNLKMYYYIPWELKVAIATLEATDQSSCGSTNSLVGVCGDPDPILLGMLFEYWSYRAFLLCDPAAMNFLIKAENPKLNLNRMSSWKSAHKLSKCKWYNLEKYVIINKN